MLSIVIPTWQAAETLPATLSSLAEAETLESEVIAADGGSSDGTAALIAGGGGRLVEAARGRGVQLAAGAREARGDWLLFLHADTVLEQGWSREAARFMVDPANARRAGVFRFALDDPALAARRVEALVAWRCRLFGLAYGDQGLLIAREFYQSLGGFKPLALMEDVDLVRRIGRRRIVILEAKATTSAARYRRTGYLRRSLRNMTCLGLYLLGVDGRVIARLYG